MMFEIIANTDNFVVALKPANWDFHNDNGQLGFFNAVKQQLGYQELYPVHRLDKVTSGLIVMARNLLTEQTLNKAFQDHSIEKYYLALGSSKPNKKQGLVIGDMERSRNSSWKLTRTKNNPATTRFYSFPTNIGKRVFLLKPFSGKTHQLRVAMKSLSSPILGDKLYKGDAADRVYLHAFCLRFNLGDTHYCYKVLPNQGEHFKALIEDIELVEKFSTPWQLKW